MHSLLLLGGMGGLLGLCAFGLLGPWGAAIVLAGGAMAALWSPRLPPGWIMRAYRARPLDASDFPEGIALLRELARRAELPYLPRLYYVPSRVINAFATGQPDRAVVAVTDGMLRRLDMRELAGVLAHEISHIRNNDLWLMGIADLMSRMTSMLSYVGMLALLLSLPLTLLDQPLFALWVPLLLVFAPTIGSLLQLALSRAREFDADLDAAAITGDPAGLVSALAKLERLRGRAWEEIFLPGRRMPEPSLLRTHPPTQERIDRLLSLLEGGPVSPVRAWPRGSIAIADRYAIPGPPRYRALGFWC